MIYGDGVQLGGEKRFETLVGGLDFSWSTGVSISGVGLSGSGLLIGQSNQD